MEKGIDGITGKGIGLYQWKRVLMLSQERALVCINGKGYWWYHRKGHWSVSMEKGIDGITRKRHWSVSMETGIDGIAGKGIGLCQWKRVLMLSPESALVFVNGKGY